MDGALTFHSDTRPQTGWLQTMPGQETGREKLQSTHLIKDCYPKYTKISQNLSINKINNLILKMGQGHLGGLAG